MKTKTNAVIAIIVGLSIFAQADPVTEAVTIRSATGVVLNTSPVKFAAGQLKIDDVTITLPGGSLVGTGDTYSNPAWITSLAASKLTGALPALSGASLTSLTAANLTGALPAISGANLTSLTAANLTGTLPAISGVNLTNVNATKIGNVTVTGTPTSGQVPTATSGTAATWQTPSGGGGAISEANVAYINSGGNDTTGTGTIGAPYLTLQEAFNDGFRIFDLGTGSYSLTTAGTVTLYVRGRGFGSTSVAVTAGGALTMHDYGNRSFSCAANTRGIAGAPAFACTLYGVSGTTAYANGANGIVEGQAGADGAAVTIYGPCTWATVDASGGSGSGDVEMAGGGNGGSITLIGQVKVAADIFVVGGPAAPAGGSAGTDGNLVLRDGPNIPTPNPDAGDVTNAVIGGVHYGNSYP